MSALAGLVIRTAQSFAGKIFYAGNGTVAGADKLLELYKTTGPGGSSALYRGLWSPLHEKGVSSGMWVRKKPLTPTPNQETVDKYCTNNEADGTVAWCGIFAVYVLKKAGFTAYWADQMINCTSYTRWGDGVTATPPNYKEKVEPGDICCLDTKPGARNNHHFIVVSLNKNTGAMDTIEGNLSVPKQSVQALSGKRNVKDIYTLYKLAARYDPTEI